MRKKLICVYLLTTFCTYGQSDVKNLIDSKRLTNYLSFRYDNSKAKPNSIPIYFGIDHLKNTEFKPLKPNTKLLLAKIDLSEQIPFYFEFINPLKFTASISSTDKQDPTTESLRQFTESLSELVNIVTTNKEKTNDEKAAASLQIAAVGRTASSSAVSQLPTIDTTIASNLIEWKYLYINFLSNGNKKCKDYGDLEFCNLEASLNNLQKIYYDGDVKKTGSFINIIKVLIDDWSAKNSKQVFLDFLQKDTAGNFVKRINILKEKIPNDDITKIENYIKNEVTFPAEPDATDNDRRKMYFYRYTKLVLKRHIDEIKKIKKQRESLIKSLEDLKTQLVTYVGPAADDDYKNHIEVGMLQISDEKMKEVNISISKKNVNILEDKVVLNVTKDSTYAKVVIRKYYRFIPEYVTTGFYFTRDLFPQFEISEETIDGKKQSILRQKDKKVNMIPTAGLNLYANIWRDLNPMLQIGVGAVPREIPCFLLGGGIRVNSTTPFSITCGGVWGFRNILKDSERLNKIIKEDEKLDDLVDKNQFDTKPKFYLGINIKL